VLHEASAEGAIAGRNAALFPNVRKAKRSVPLAIMFTDPALATIGATPSDAMVVGSNSYADQGRAKVEARNAGVVRVYADRDRGVIKDACLFGPGMDHIAHRSRGQSSGPKLRALCCSSRSIIRCLKKV
jgi:dihydrolipoamide dehydrogenase